MRKLRAFLLGAVQLHIEGTDPALVLNLWRRAAISFWQVHPRGNFALTVWLYRRDWARALRLAEKAQCQAELRAQWGLLRWLAPLRRRPALLLGALLCTLALPLLSHCVWNVDVVGNETVSSGEIRLALRRCGLYPGAYAPRFAARSAAHKVLQEIPALSFLSINFMGTRAEVRVHEGTKAPPLIHETDYYDVTARETGVVLSVEALRGKAQVKAGDLVWPGLLLIAGKVQPAAEEGSDDVPEPFIVHAEGRVMARTWHSETACIPRRTQKKVYTGESRRRLFFSWQGSRRKIFGNSSIPFDNYDKITTYQHWPQSDACPLLTLEQETLREYRIEPALRAEEAELARLKRQLLQELCGEMREGTLESHCWEVRRGEDELSVTLLAQCVENIAREEPRAAEELPPPAETAPAGRTE